METTVSQAGVKEKIVSITQVVKLDVNSIIPNPNQPRKEFEPEALALLAETIKTRGDVEDPVKVCPWKDGFYMLIDGERRWRGAKLASVTHISAIIRPPLSKSEMHEISVLLNLCKRDMTPLEKGIAFAKIMENRGINQADLSKMVGISPPEISAYLKFLNLHPEMQQLLKERRITTAIALNLANHKPEHQHDILSALNEQLSKKRSRASAVDISRMIRKIAEEKGYILSRRRRKFYSSAELAASSFERTMNDFCSELAKICNLERNYLLQLKDPSVRNILEFIDIVKDRLSRAEDIITEKIE